MPAKLKDACEAVKWRIREDDLSLLRARFGEGGVNPAVRDLIHAWCERMRERDFGGGKEGA